MNTQLRSVTDVLTALQADVQAEDTVIESAITLINGIPGLIAAAVTQATAAGATADQLAAFGALADDITARSSALANAVANAPGGAAPKQTGSPTT